MATLAELEDALVNADRAGNTKDAEALANAIVSMREAETVPIAAPRPVPSIGAVAVNAAAKGLAAIPDSIRNAPTHIYNIGKAAFGMTAYALGFKDIGDAVEMTPPPDLFHKIGQAAGGIRPAADPQTGGQRILDTAVQGAIGMAIAPAGTVGQAAKNLALGATSGAAAGATKEATGSPLAAIAVGMLTPVAVRHGLNGLGKGATNEVLGETLKDGLDAGYVVPPSAIKPGFVANKLESLGGKAAVRQQAALQNQEVTNALAAKALGLPEGTVLTEAKLAAYRDQAAQPYRDVTALSPDAGGMLQQLRQARHDATLYFKHYDRSADPKSLSRAMKLQAKAEQLDQAIDQAATQAGRPELIAQLREARTAIAKSYDIERALNVGDGNVSATVIGRLLDQGKPLSGELKVIGRFAQAFPSVTREAAMVPTPGVSALDPLASAAFGMGGYAAAGGPAGLLAAGLPLLRGPARSLTLSDLMQKRLIREPPGLGETFTKSIFAGRTASEQPTAP